MPRKPLAREPVSLALAPLVVRNLARRLGLTITVYDYGRGANVLWMFRSVATGREVGSFVPCTCYVRAASVWKQVRCGRTAVRLVARQLANVQTRGRAA